jgi:hypothetical protein
MIQGKDKSGVFITMMLASAIAPVFFSRLEENFACDGLNFLHPGNMNLTLLTKQPRNLCSAKIFLNYFRGIYK